MDWWLLGVRISATTNPSEIIVIKAAAGAYTHIYIENHKATGVKFFYMHRDLQFTVLC